jgi:hypothetical protein
MKINLKLITTICATCLSLQASASDWGSYGDQYEKTRDYKVTITNLTKGVSFTPLLAATHNRNVSLFTLGEAASDNVSRVAEGGDVSGLNTELSQSDDVHATTTSAGLLGPGESVTLDIKGTKRAKNLSIISMLLPTNDTMVALRGVKLPRFGSKTVLLSAYDGGTETNDESCANIPGPHCGGTPFSPEDVGEGYVYPSPSIHGEGDLSAKEYQWDGVVAKVVIEVN